MSQINSDPQEWCLRGIEELLKQLSDRGLRPVSVGKLAELADPTIEAHL